MHSFTPILMLFSCAATLPAQAGAVPTSPWHLPFAAAPDVPGELWAAGADYKVVVDDGATFYPRLGATRAENQPLRWRTRCLRIDGTDVLPVTATAPTRRVDGFRVELDHGALIEIYEARDDGVAQSFLVRRPERVGAGAIELVGEITGPLHSEPRAPAHAELVFADAQGMPMVGYGAAFAIDAAGRRLPLTSAFADGRITLRVPAAWLEAAAWPITIDPLLTRQVVWGSAASPARGPQVVRARTLDRLFIAEARQSAGIDWDLTVRAYDDALNLIGHVFSDLSTLSTETCSLALTDAENRLVVALAREAFLQHHVRLYFHDGASLAINSGTTLDVPRPANTHDNVPSIGGSQSRYCYLTFRRDSVQFAGNTPQSRAVGAFVDTQSQTLGPVQDLHTLAGNNYDAEGPRVSGYSEAGGWMVVWQEYNYDNAGDDWDVIAQRISAGGALLGGAALGQASANGWHKLTPHVAGSGSRFAVVFVLRANPGTKTTALEGTSMYFQRVNWPSGGAVQMEPAQLVEINTTETIVLGDVGRALEFDFVTDSLWAATWARLDRSDLRVGRFGYDGKLAERATDQTFVGSFHSPSLCFDPDGMGFPLVYGSTGVWAGDATLARHFVHGAANAVPFGASCAGTMSTINNGTNRPYAGSEFFAIRLLGGRANVPSALVAGAGPTALPLPNGAPGCTLLIDPSLPLLVLPAGVSQPSGELIVGLPIPSATVAIGLRWQFVQVDGGLLWSSSGLRTDIR